MQVTNEQIEQITEACQYAVRTNAWRFRDTPYIGAEDLMQEALVRVLEVLPNYDPAKASIETFVNMVVRRWIFSMAKKAQRSLRREREAAKSEIQRPDDIHDLPLDVLIRFPGGQWAWNFARMPRAFRMMPRRRAQDGQLYVVVSKLGRVKARR
jgi:RNA polymerase sigma factor (sigma-70 family)